MDIAKPAPISSQPATPPVTPSDAAHRCRVCGRPRTVLDIRGLDWTSEHAPDGTVSWVCAPCTRANLFEIETGLPLSAARLPASA